MSKNQQNIFYPWSLVILSAFSIFHPYCVQYSFSSYLPQMVHELGTNWDTVGYEVGMIMAIYNVSSAVGDVVTGFMLVFISMKNTLIVLNALFGISLILLGFANDLIYFKCTIAFVGLFRSIIVVSKTNMYKICDAENQKNIIMWSYSGPVLIAMSFSPFLSGLLAVPAAQYPSIFDSEGIFKQCPALLVNLGLGVLSLILSLTFYYVQPPDTNLKQHLRLKKSLYHSEMDTNDTDLQVLVKVADKKLKDGNEVSFSEIVSIVNKDILMNKPMLISIIGSFLYGGTLNAYQSFWPLWLETPKSHRGRGYDAKDVSLLLLISGVMIGIINYTMLWRVNTVMKSRKVFTLSVLVSISFNSCLPCLTPIKNEVSFDVFFVLFHVILMLLNNLILAAIQVLLQNNASNRAIGMIFSLTQLLVALSSATITFLQTSAFASLTRDPARSWPPLDYHLPFYLTSLIILLGYIPTLFAQGDFENTINSH